VLKGYFHDAHGHAALVVADTRLLLAVVDRPGLGVDLAERAQSTGLAGRRHPASA
jgi:hypothetical protein